MQTTMTRLTAAVAIGLATSLTTAGTVENYSTVTPERLQNPEPHNWLMYRGNYEGWGYSELDQIKRQNVANLQPVWTISTGVLEGHQAPPIVNDGVMFVATPMNQVMALDAKTGDLIWRYQKEIPEEMFQLHPTNRGVGLLGDMLYFASIDCTLVALDAKTGEVHLGKPSSMTGKSVIT